MSLCCRPFHLADEGKLIVEFEFGTGLHMETKLDAIVIIGTKWPGIHFDIPEIETESTANIEGKLGNIDREFIEFMPPAI